MISLFYFTVLMTMVAVLSIPSLSSKKKEIKVTVKPSKERLLKKKSPPYYIVK